MPSRMREETAVPACTVQMSRGRVAEGRSQRTYVRQMDVSAHDDVAAGGGPRRHGLPMAIEQVVLVAVANGEHRLMHDDDA